MKTTQFFHPTIKTFHMAMILSGISVQSKTWMMEEGQEKLKSPSLSTSVFTTKGRRLKMEDTIFCSSDGRFIGVFDGHGGSDVSTLLRAKIWPTFRSQLAEHDNMLGFVHARKDIQSALRHTFRDLEHQVLQREELDHQVGILVPSNIKRNH